MLGWNIGVYRMTLTENAPSGEGATGGVRLAVWQTGLGGLDWITGLVEADQAVDLGGDGYPNRFKARARHVLPVLLSGPPAAKAVWSVGPEDLLLPGWVGSTTIDKQAMDQCDPDEWLLIEAWDES